MSVTSTYREGARCFCSCCLISFALGTLLVAFFSARVRDRITSRFYATRSSDTACLLFQPLLGARNSATILSSAGARVNARVDWLDPGFVGLYHGIEVEYEVPFMVRQAYAGAVHSQSIELDQQEWLLEPSLRDSAQLSPTTRTVNGKQ